MNPNPGPGVSTSFIEGHKSILTVKGEADIYVSHLDVENAATSSGYMLVDLASTNFPHSERGHVDVNFVHINANPDASFAGDIEIGFISDAGTADADFNSFYTLHFGQAASEVVADIAFTHGHMKSDTWIGPTTDDDPLFGTAVNNPGPDGNNYNAHNGDIVLKITRTAGAIDLGITLEYDTHA